MKKSALLSLFVASQMALSPTNLLAQEDDSALLGDDFRVSYDSEINTNYSAGAEEGDSVNLDGSYVSLSVEWKNKIRGVIKTKLEQIFQDNRVEFNDDFSLGEFIKEAYIEIREINGSPMAIVVGKQPMAFGQNVEAMPLFENNPLSEMQDIDEVFGVTVDLSEGLFGVFDQAEFSVFETEQGDFKIGEVDGVSLRLSKMLTDQVLLTLSHAELGNSHLDTGHERRTSVGLIGESTDGVLVGWVEGLYFSNSPEYPDADFGITTGAMMRVHETTDVIVEYSYIQKELHEIGLGVRTNLTENVSIGAEVRYQNYVEDNRGDDVIFGISLTYKFGSTPYSKNDTYLFGEDNEEDPYGNY